jgi:hypothetical protein
MTPNLTACFVSVLAHELAHIVAAAAFGVRVKRVGLRWKGPYIVREAGTPAQNLCISLAGPAINALLMFVPGLFLINLALLVPNLVLKESDGRRAWKCWQVLASSKGSRPAGKMAPPMITKNAAPCGNQPGTFACSLRLDRRKT